MTRRGLLTPALAAALAACSPLALMNRFAPRDSGAGAVARGLAYGGHPRQRLDLFAPGGPGPWPVLVFFYGGGWHAGSREQYGWVAQALASRGFLVALPDYRLVPEVRFPTFLEDAAAAVAAVVRLAPGHGGDPGRLAVAGHSAGAHLALMLALDARYLEAAGAPGVIDAAAGLAGPYEFLPFDVPASLNAFGHVADPRQTQPVAFARADAPPLWLGHGLRDTTVHAEDSVILAEAVAAAGGRAEARLYPELDHAGVIAALSPLFRSRAPVLDEMTGFLHRALG